MWFLRLSEPQFPDTPTIRRVKILRRIVLRAHHNTNNDIR
jgi:hypothetical protein